MMKFWLVLVVLLLMVGAAAIGAPCGPLVAGTAPGPMSVASPFYAVGVHYPCDPPCKIMDYGDLRGSFPRPFNGTYPYSEWPDRARVPGKKAAMSPEYVIQSSSRRN